MEKEASLDRFINNRLRIGNQFVDWLDESGWPFLHGRFVKLDNFSVISAENIFIRREEFDCSVHLTKRTGRKQDVKPTVITADS